MGSCDKAGRLEVHGAGPSLTAYRFRHVSMFYDASLGEKGSMRC